MIHARLWLWAAVALLLSGCATSRVPPMVAKPPPGYEKAGGAILKVDTPERIAEECKNAEALMCAKGVFIFAPFPWLYPDDPYAVALWHELAHVFGWPADHPGSR